MRLDLTEILREAGKMLPYDIHEPPLVDDDLECTHPITGRVDFTNAGGTLIIRGNAQTRVALPCSRCSQYYEQPVAVTIDEQFELKHVTAGPRTLQTVTVVEEDESAVAGRLFEGHVLNLTEMLRQFILLDEPTRPLPPTTPNGLCAHCHRRPEDVFQSAGVERASNETGVHPAFAKLGELLDNNES